MPATVTQLRPHAPQPAPDEATATAAFTRVMWEAAIAEGYRRAYAELGIPYFPQPAPVRSRVLVLSPPGPSS